MRQIISILTFLQLRGSCGLIHLLKLVNWASTPHILLSVWHLVLLVINSIMEVSYVALLIAHQSSGLWHRSVNFAACIGQEVTTRTMFSCCSFCLWNWFLLWEESWNLRLRCGEILSMIVLLWCVLSSVKQCGALWFCDSEVLPLILLFLSVFCGWDEGLVSAERGYGERGAFS